jgi:SAM-dependent methyltransferase
VPSIAAFVRESPIQRAPIAAAVERFSASLPAGARVLDAGAGDAPYASLFAHCAYVTQDWPGSVHAGAGAAAIVADLHALPVADASFDAVVCTEVLEHVAEPARVLGELFRVLAPGGRVLVSVPFVNELHEEPHDHYRYTSWGLRGLLERAGFAVSSLEASSGWFATLAQLLRHAGAATLDPAQPRLVGRVVALGLRGVGELLRLVAPALDRRLDSRRALPLGWIAVASCPAHGPVEQESLIV